MKILEISCQGGVGLPNTGPVTNVIEQLSREFQSLGHEVTVADCKSDLERNLLPSGIKLFELDAPPMHMVFRSMRSSGRSLLKKALDANMARIIKEATNSALLQKYDVVHVHDSQIAVALSKIPGVVCVYTCHTPNEWIALDQYRSFRGWLNLLKLRLAGHFGQNDLRAIRLARLTVGLGPHLAQAVSTLSPSIDCAKKIVSIPNGINLDSWPRMTRDEARSALSIDPAEFRLQFTGRLTPSKGIHTLIEAVNLLKSRIPNLHLSIVGGCPIGNAYVTSLIDTAKGLPVTFQGYMNNHDITYHRLMAAADICVVPSLFDNQPTVVMESLALGVPVVGSRVAGIPMMVTPEVGRLFDAGNASDLCEVIFDLYNNQAVLHQLRSATRAHVENTYSWSRVAERYINAFRRAT